MTDPTPPTRCDVLVTGGTVVTVDDACTILPAGDVAIVGDRIAWVGPAGSVDPATATTVVDAAGCAVIPGFVDCHTHLFQNAAKSIGEGLELWPWLCDVMWPLTHHQTPDGTVAAVRLGAVEAASAGITAVMDNHYGVDDVDTTSRVVATIAEVGLRGIVARGMTGSKSPASATRSGAARPWTRETDEDLAITAELMARFPASGQVSVSAGPNNIAYAQHEMIAACVELARTHGTRWHTHCCEVEGDPQVYRDVYGTTPVMWLADNGLLGPETTLAHAIWLSDDDIAAAGDHHAGVAHNPLSNQYLASGTARWPEMRRHGVSVGLGTDGPACGHRMDPFETMKQAVLVQRMASGDATITTAAEVLRLATRGGAEYLGIEAGTIAVGRLADLCVVDLSAPHLNPHHDVVAALVYCATTSDVRATFVGGRPVVVDGALSTVDVAEAVAEGAARAAEALARAGLSPAPDPVPAFTP